MRIFIICSHQILLQWSNWRWDGWGVGTREREDKFIQNFSWKT